MSKQIVEGFRLSPQQSQLWLLQRNSSAYNATCAVIIDGVVDQTVLAAALARVIERHEILRTSFHAVPGLKAPLQVIAEEAAITLDVVDLQGIPADEQLLRIDEAVRQQNAVPFDLENGPLLRASLRVLSLRKSVLIISLPGTSADNATLANLFEEICSSYESVVTASERDSSAVQYNQVSEWLNELLEDGDPAFARLEDLDSARLAEVAIPGEILATKDQSSFSPDVLTFDIDLETCERADQLVRTCGSTPATFWLCCWNILLWRLTGQQRIVIGYADDGRNYDELKSVLGPITTHVPVDSRLVRDYRFVEALDRLHKDIGNAKSAHEYFVWGSNGSN